MCEAIRTNTTSISFEEQLTRELFENRGYNTKVRPVSFGSDYLRVNFSLALIQITDLNVKDKESVLAVWIYFRWYDAGLMWNPDDYGGLDVVSIPASELWLPDFYLTNSVAENWDSKFMTMARVYNDGRIQWTSPATIKATCQTKIYYFPFDVQNCTLWFTTWTQSAQKMDVYRK